jgi:hypothetical protein|tara:strand:+ start:2102 stop:2263 length:162 start_codon:yes stop_codon:yes gene_type:complete
MGWMLVFVMISSCGIMTIESGQYETRRECQIALEKHHVSGSNMVIVECRRRGG